MALDTNTLNFGLDKGKGLGVNLTPSSGGTSGRHIEAGSGREGVWHGLRHGPRNKHELGLKQGNRDWWEYRNKH